MLVQSGPAWVLASGSATTFGGHPLALVLQMADDNLAVELRFEEDPAAPGAAVRSAESPTGWIFRCVNFEPLAGRGSAEPVLLGEIGEDLVFLHFRAFRYGASRDWTVHYTFFRAHKARVGWTARPG